MALLPLLNVDSFLQAYNFIYARECGKDLPGLRLAFTIGLIDNLILSEKTVYFNYQFIDSM